MTTTMNPSRAGKPAAEKLSRSCIHLFGKTCIYTVTLVIGALTALALIWTAILLFG